MRQIMARKLTPQMSFRQRSLAFRYVKARIPVLFYRLCSRHLKVRSQRPAFCISFLVRVSWSVALKASYHCETTDKAGDASVLYLGPVSIAYHSR
jgi:hypothetical protein